jgi:hypothetical protein
MPAHPPSQPDTPPVLGSVVSGGATPSRSRP